MGSKKAWAGKFELKKPSCQLIMTKSLPCPRAPGKNTIPSGPCRELPSGLGPAALGPWAAPGRDPWVWYFFQDPSGKDGILYQNTIFVILVKAFYFGRNSLFQQNKFILASFGRIFGICCHRGMPKRWNAETAKSLFWSDTTFFGPFFDQFN